MNKNTVVQMTDERIDALWNRYASNSEWMMKRIVREFSRALLSAVQADQQPAVPAQPVAHVVFDGEEPVHCASYSAACQEHINDAINEFHVEGAGSWKVVPVFAAPVKADTAVPADQGAQNNYHDAYRGARDDMQEWKKRALEAEESCRKLTQALNEQNGPTHMGEPVTADQGAIEPFGYVLKTGHGNSFRETLEGVHADARHLWVAVDRRAAAPSQQVTRNAVLEEAAKVCEKWIGWTYAPQHLAEEIRALKTTAQQVPDQAKEAGND